MATANIQTTDKDQKPLVSLPDQNVIDLLISLAASFGLEVTRSATKRPLPMNSEERKPSGKVVVHGHRTKSLFARELLRFRRLRDRYFAGDLFADPAWDMLLDLYAARSQNSHPVSVSSLCIASSVPATTALRWIKAMEEMKLLSRRADPSDGRRIFIELTDHAMQKMDALIEALMNQEWLRATNLSQARDD